MNHYNKLKLQQCKRWSFVVSGLIEYWLIFDIAISIITKCNFHLVWNIILITISFIFYFPIVGIDTIQSLSGVANDTAEILFNLKYYII